ncbi:hypothetical protein ABFS83_12G076700 [Erythranthe nasuta]
MAKIMIASFSVLMILMCLVPGGISGEVDCNKVPVGNITECGPFITGLSEKPSPKCCEGAQSWLSVPAIDICICYKGFPNLVPFQLNLTRVASLQCQCGLSPGFADIVFCLPRNVL